MENLSTQNQLAITDGLRANQKAITDGLEKINETNERLADMGEVAGFEAIDATEPVPKVTIEKESPNIAKFKAEDIDRNLLNNESQEILKDNDYKLPSLTPHYTSLGLLKFTDIVKLNTCMLFYDCFHHKKFPYIPVSLVSELHNYSTRSASSNQVAIPLFRTNLRRFCPSIIGSFLWNDIPQSIRDKPSKKMFKKALLRWYLAQY